MQAQEYKRTIDELKQALKISKDKYNEVKHQKDDLEALMKETLNKNKNKNRHTKQFWYDICQKLREEPEYIKHLLQTNKLTVSDVSDTEGTVLHYAAAIGAYDIVQLCINLGADLNHKDDYDKTALDYSMRSNYADIVQLLRLSAMNANIGDRVRSAAFDMNKQNGINENILTELGIIGTQTKEIFEKTLLEVMINIINKRKAFCDNLLNLCWIIESENGKNRNVLNSELWNAINNTCKQIIECGSKRDWYWLRKYVINSTVWYQDVNINSATDEKGKTDEAKPEYLYFKLLQLTKDKELDLKNKLKSNMEKQEKSNVDLWKKLVNFDVSKDLLLNMEEISTNNGRSEITNMRQDNIPNGVSSEYTFNELTTKFTTSSTFNSHKFYDYNQYLPRLQMIAQIVDDKFHKSIQNIFNINKDTQCGHIQANMKIMNEFEEKKSEKESEIILYRRGPVKLIERAKNKAENDYFWQQFPSSACILDFNRCCLVFADINSLLFSIELFVNKIQYYQSGNIIAICRCKNGFKQYIAEIGYADIKLNVLIKGTQSNIIGEVQFLLNAMDTFKAKNHSLYAIQREEEYIQNSVSKILPSLLNHKKQIFIASQRGNIDVFRQFTVHSNKTDKDFMIYDLDENGRKRSLLYAICEKGYVKTFEYLQSMTDAKLFVKHVCRGPYDTVEYSSISASIRNNQLLMMQKICGNVEIINYFKSNDDQLQELLSYAFTYCSNELLIDFILQRFEITTQQLSQISKKKYPKISDEICAIICYLFINCGKSTNIEWIRNRLNITDEQIINAMNEKISDKYTVIGRMIYYGNEDNLFPYLMKLIGEKHFLNHLFASDKYNKNGLECVISHNRILIMKYLLSIKNIKQKCLMDKEILYRIVYWTKNDELYNKALIEYIKEEFNLNEQTLRELQKFKCTDSFDYKQWAEIEWDGHKYWEKTLSDEDIKKILNK